MTTPDIIKPIEIELDEMFCRSQIQNAENLIADGLSLQQQLRERMRDIKAGTLRARRNKLFWQRKLKKLQEAQP